MLLFHLDKNSRDTYYEQIRGQLILHVLCSNIREGDQLPPIRETARMLRINPNTVFKIYRRLKSDHLLEVRHGSGAYVSKSLYGISQFNQDLLKFIANTFRQAEARFSFTPRIFANLMYQYISKTGSIDDVYVVINDDETKEIDANLLSAHFRCRFVPMDVNALENPSAGARQLMREARGYITTKYHLERVAKLVSRSGKRLIEIKRDPRFVTSVLESAADREVLVVFQHSVTCDHFRDLVFKKLYPEMTSHLSLVAIGDKKLLGKVRFSSVIYTSPLCHKAIVKMASPQAKVIQIEGWISRESLDDIRALLLYPSDKARAAN